jgi:hypothetical protein
VGDGRIVTAILDEELRYHVERQIELNERNGMTPEEARRQALLQFGNVPLVKEDTRAVWTRGGLEQFLQDLRFGARILTQSPGLSATRGDPDRARDRDQHHHLLDRQQHGCGVPAPGVTADDLVQGRDRRQPGNPGSSVFRLSSNIRRRRRRCGR